MANATQERGGRVVTQKDLTTDYTLTITNVDDGALQISNNLKSINLIDDIGGGILRKVDYWDEMPESMSSAVSRGYLGRTVIYTGDTKTINGVVFEKGCAYKCVPKPTYTWINLFEGASAQILKCESAVDKSDIKDASGNVIAIGTGDYILISTGDGNARCIIYFDTDTTYGSVIKLASGCTTIAEAQASSNNVIVYKLVTDTWTRTDEINQYVNLFTNCTVSHIAYSLGYLFKGHENAASETTPDWAWELITDDEVVSISPYETVYPVNNVCYLSSTPSFFNFGVIPSTSDTLDITLDLTSFGQGAYYNNNVLYFETSKVLTLNITGTKGGLAKTVNTIGDSITGAGKYRVEIECLPDDTVCAIVTQIDATSASDVTGSSAYGIRYTIGSTMNVRMIEMRRKLNSSGDVVEDKTDVTATSFTQMPCHEFKRCVIKDFSEGPNYYLFDSNSLYKTDGNTPADLTGVDGDVCVEIPKAYMRITKVASSGSTEATRRSLTEGTFECLISNTAIPDPPDDGSVIVTVYNGVHPAFRVGGTLSSGYETKYNPETGLLEATNVLLRDPKDKLYLGAFASVRCHHGTNGLEGKTLKVDATTITESSDYVTPSGSFADQGNYPRLQSGIAAGVQADDDTFAQKDPLKVMTAINTEARSVAPYRDGDMLYASFPGVSVVIKSSSSSYPAAMPGGCDATFMCASEHDFTYYLTTDTIFQSGKAYFTKSGQTYTRATVEIGATITGEYYNRRMIPTTQDTFTWTNKYVDSSQQTVTKEYTLAFDSTTNKWTIKYGSTLIASSELINSSSFNTFTGLSWDVVEVAGVTQTCVTTDTIYRLYAGPYRYGTRNANQSTWWASQKYWDSAITGNPNWALNYRPMVNQPRNFYNIVHGNGYLTDPADPFYAYTLLSGDKNTVFEQNPISLASGSDSCTFGYVVTTTCPASESIQSNPNNVWYGQNANGVAMPSYNISFDATAGGWAYTDGSNTIVMDNTYASKNDYFALTTDTTVISGKAYFTRSGVGPDYSYTRVADSTVEQSTSPATYVLAAEANAISTKTYYTRTGGSGTKEDPYTYAVTSVSGLLLTKASETSALEGRTYYLRTGSGTAASPYVYTLQNFTVGQDIPSTGYYMTNSTYYESAPYYEANVPLIINCELIDNHYRYLDLYDTGYKPSFSYNPSTTESTIGYGITLGTWSASNDVTTTNNRLLSEYSYSVDSDSHSLVFDHPTLRWKIKRSESSGIKLLYQSDRIDAAAFAWGGDKIIPVADKTYFYRTDFTRDATSASSTISVGLIPTVTTGSGTLVFTNTSVAGSGVYERRWDNATNALRIEYISDVESLTNVMTEKGERYELTTDYTAQADQIYFDSNHTQLVVAEGTVLPANTYVKCYGYYKTNDTVAKANKNYYLFYSDQSDDARFQQDTSIQEGENIASCTLYTNSLAEVYGGCWALTEHATLSGGGINDSIIKRVITSDLDLVAAKISSNIQCLFQPINPQNHDCQRTYDSTAKTTTNTSMVYKMVACTSGSLMNLQLILVDENGNIPAYFNDKSTTLTDAIKKMVDAYKGRWVILKYTNGDYSALDVSGSEQTETTPYAWSETFTSAGPWCPYINFVGVKGAAVGDVDIANNERALRFKNTTLMSVKAKSSGRGFTANARIRQYLAMLMAIEFGTFDIFNVDKFKYGKLSLKNALSRGTLYGSATFSGRTAKFGITTGSVSYDEDIDINIKADDFVTDDKVVAINWRGIENPFGNIGEYDEGIIPMIRFINGVKKFGYYECIDPGAYSDALHYTDRSKHPFVYGSHTSFSPVWYTLMPSSTYTWNDSTVQNSGFITYMDPVTTLPLSTGAASKTTYFTSYWKNKISDNSSVTPWAIQHNGYSLFAYHNIYVPTSGDQHNSIFDAGFDYLIDTSADMIGARLQY